MVKLVYKGSFAIAESVDAGVIALTNEEETRVLTILTIPEVAMKIKEYEQHKDEERIGAVDVLAKILKEDDAARYEIEVLGIKGVGLKTKLVNVDTDQSYLLQIEDAILLSLMNGYEILTSEEVIKNFSTPYEGGMQRVSIPILTLPDRLLELALQRAVDDEKYEDASYIRDEIKRREEKAKNANK